MAEDPKPGLLRRHVPVLGEMVLTWGKPYPPEQLQALDGLLAEYLELPPLESGLEAFVRHQPCDPLRYFSGWRMLRPELARPERYRSPYIPPDSQPDWNARWRFPEEGTIPAFDLHDDQVFTPPMLERLQALGRGLGRADAPRVFLLWENSD